MTWTSFVWPRLSSSAMLGAGRRRDRSRGAPRRLATGWLPSLPPPFPFPLPFSSSASSGSRSSDLRLRRLRLDRRRGEMRSFRRRCRRRPLGCRAEPPRPCRHRCRQRTVGVGTIDQELNKASSSRMATRVSRGFPEISISRFKAITLALRRETSAPREPVVFPSNNPTRPADLAWAVR